MSCSFNLHSECKRSFWGDPEAAPCAELLLPLLSLFWICTFRQGSVCGPRRSSYVGSVVCRTSCHVHLEPACWRISVLEQLSLSHLVPLALGGSLLALLCLSAQALWIQHVGKALSLHLSLGWQKQFWGDPVEAPCPELLLPCLRMQKQFWQFQGLLC